VWPFQQRFTGRAEELVEAEVEFDDDGGRAGERREEVEYNEGEQARCLERGEARPWQKIGRLSLRQLPAYTQREP
jgi:hypothetical protein